MLTSSAYNGADRQQEHLHAWLANLVNPKLDSRTRQGRMYSSLLIHSSSMRQTALKPYFLGFVGICCDETGSGRHFASLCGLVALLVTLTLIEPAMAQPAAPPKKSPAAGPSSEAPSVEAPATEAPAAEPPIEDAQEDTEKSTPEPDAKPAEAFPPKTGPSAEKPAEKPQPQEPPEKDSNTPSPDETQKETPASKSEADPPQEEEKTVEPVAVAWDDAMAKLATKKHPETVAELKRLQRQVQRVVTARQPVTVAVTVGDSIGSGVIVSSDGFVLTAGHVAMEPNLPVTFLFPDGSRARGITLGVNRTIDSGMMRITDPGPWAHAPIAETTASKRKALVPGEWVVALGQPNGYFRDRAPPVRLGRVLYQNDDVINTDCTLVGGDSGGPLFNLKGELVGIHSRIGPQITSNFHVPISTYNETWDRLAAALLWGGGFESDEPSQYRPLLGLAGDPLAKRCVVTQVFRGMPASRADIQQGDIVVKFAGEAVTTFADLAAKLLAQKPGEQIEVVVQRDGEELVRKLWLGRIAYDFPGGPRRGADTQLAGE